MLTLKENIGKKDPQTNQLKTHNYFQDSQNTLGVVGTGEDSRIISGVGEDDYDLEGLNLDGLNIKQVLELTG